MTLNTTEQQFLHLLRCGVRQETPDALLFPAETTQWQTLMDMSDKQAVTGLIFWAVRQLPKELQPPRKEIFLPWLSSVDELVKRNDKLNRTSLNTQAHFERDGFHACLLKGQGVAQHYPDPSLRTSGDIDMWLWPKDVSLGDARSLERRRKSIVAYVRKRLPETEVVYHHADFNVLKTIPLEVHFTPSWMNAPGRNRYLQRWMERQAAQQFCAREGELTTPTLEFNAVYLLLHIFRHLFNEGIGLRQIVDYYYIIYKEETLAHRSAIVETLGHLGLLRFAGAMMYVLGEVFGLSEEHYLVPANPQEGRRLLREILLAGNFGKYDDRFSHYADGTFGAFWTRSLRNLQFLRSYPCEVICTPLWKIGHYLWRRKEGFL